MAQHQLNDADVHAVSQQPAGALVPEVAPAEIDPPQLLSWASERFDMPAPAFATTSTWKVFAATE